MKKLFFRSQTILMSYFYQINEKILHLFLKRIKILPLVIFCASMLFTVKITTNFSKFSEYLNVFDINHAYALNQKETNPSFSSSSNKFKKPVQDLLKDVTPDDKNLSDQSHIKNFSDFDPLKMTSEDFKILQSLTEREKQLESRAVSPAQTAASQAIESQIHYKIAEFTKIQEKLQHLYDKIKDQNDPNILRLVKMAETMKAKEASIILEKVEFSVLVEIMEKIKESKASAILTNMDPEKASYLMTELANRKKIFKSDK